MNIYITYTALDVLRVESNSTRRGVKRKEMGI